MSTDYQNSILWRGEDPLKKKWKPQRDVTIKTTRYFPGKAPKWADEAKETKEEREAREKREKEEKRDRERAERRAGAPDRDDLARARRRRRGEAVVVEDAAVSRLKRLARSDTSTSAPDARQERLLRHRVIHDARVLEAAEEDKAEEAKKEEELKEEKALAEGGHGLAEVVGNVGYDEVSGSDEDDNELRALRRERARDIALAKRKEEEDILKEEQEDELEDDDEEESEEESDDDEDRLGARLKPVFVSKAQRETLKEKEAIEKEEELALEKKVQKEKERKAESKTLLVDEVKRDEEAEREGANENDASDIELIDDDDEKNEAEEYELWKIRELKRIKRDKEERLDRERELEWIMKRRAMTDAERMADDAKLDNKAHLGAEAKNFNFMQKYYHKGGFFQDKAAAGDEPLYLRDYHEPLEEEKYDKNLLPKAMQLRRGQFGKKGQVKHTHLTEADTTDMNAAWSQHTKQMQKYQEKMAAASGVNSFDRPSTSSRKTLG